MPLLLPRESQQAIRSENQRSVNYLRSKNDEPAEAVFFGDYPWTVHNASEY